LQKVYATIMTLSCDSPLQDKPETLLERKHAAFLILAAHEARMVFGLSLLHTGAANDVSGCLRITMNDLQLEEDIGEKEFLYFIGGDASVKIFERGQ
jgi:elongator complex protein 6